MNTRTTLTGRLANFAISFLIISIFHQSLLAQQTARMTSGGTGYLEYLPADYAANPTKKYPAIIFLHGAGETGSGSPADLEKVKANGPPKLIQAGNNMCFTVNGQQECFIVLSPQLSPGAGGWWASIQQSFLDYVMNGPNNYRIDKDRVYLTGLSLGGQGVYIGLGSTTDIFAAGAVIAGFDNGNWCTISSRRLPVWGFHGQSDGTIAYNTGLGAFNNIVNCTSPAPSSELKWTPYPGVGHNSWDNAYRTDNSLHTPNVYQWLLSKNKTLPPVANTSGDASIVLPISSVTLTGSGTPGYNGTITSYAWAQISGPSTATLSGANSTSLNAANLIAGTYVFSFTVTDNRSATGSKNVTVTVRPVGSNLAWLRPTVVSTVESNAPSSYGGQFAVDENSTSTRWSSAPADPQWIYVDLGTVFTVNRVKITWEGARASNYEIQVSNDASSWTTIKSITGNSVLVNDNTGLSGSGRYVRMYGTTRGTGFGYSVFELEVYGTQGVSNNPPVANAGGNKTIQLPTSSVILNGSATDSDGTIASYAWTQVSGPSTATLAGNTTQNLTASALVAGSYVFRLTATDNQGATGTNDATVTINTSNTAPVVNAGGNKTIQLPTSSVVLNGSATDSDGTIASYTWTQVSGPSTATLAGNTTQNLTASALVAGSYVFRLTATDNQGAIGTNNATVTVSASNVIPVANAGGNKSITLPTNSTVLNGSATDSDGTIASYAWTQVSGPSTATLSGNTTQNLTASALVAGSYVFRLTATDNQGATGTNDAILLVNPASGTSADPSITYNGNSGYGINSIWYDKNVGMWSGQTNTNVNPGTTANTSVEFFIRQWGNTGGMLNLEIADWTATTTAAAISSYATVGSTFTKVTIPLSAISSSTLNAVRFMTIRTEPNKSVEIKGIRFVGGSTPFVYFGAENTNIGYDVAWVFTAGVVNAVPVANAGGNKIIQLPTSSVILNGTATDSDGTIASYAWTQVSGPSTATLSGNTTQNLTASALVAGSYVFRLTATDNQSATGTNDATVTINAVNVIPVANAGGNKTIQLPTSSVILNGTATDSDGTIASYAWTQVSGPSTATLAGNTTQNLTASALVAGSYVFRLTATDNQSAAGTNDATVTVSPANLVPVTNAGGNKTIQLPTSSVILNGTATDSDGTIASYAWTQVSGPSTATLSGNASQNLTASALVVGSYVFRLTATDNQGATGTNNATVTVSAANVIPVANSGGNKTIQLPTSSVILNGTATDSDGTIASYAWTQVSGPSTATLSGNMTQNLTASALVVGSYVFRLTATDNQGATGTNNATVTVNAANAIPVANAGGNKTILLPTSSVILNGIATDSDGTIASYAWTQVSGPSTATLAGNTTQNLTASALVVGLYVFRLTATDNLGATGTNDATVIVNSPILSDPSLTYNGNTGYGINSIWYDKNVGMWSGQSTVNVNPGTTANTSVEFEIRQWGNMTGMLNFEIADWNASTTGVAISSYATLATTFTKVTIPLSAFSSSTLKAVRFITIRTEPNKSIEIRGIRFVGGSTPFVYFGAENTNIGYDLSWVYTSASAGGRVGTNETSTAQAIGNQPPTANTTAPEEVVTPKFTFLAKEYVGDGYSVNIYNSNGQIQYSGKWDEQLYSEILPNPGLYLYRVMRLGVVVDTGKFQKLE